MIVVATIFAWLLLRLSLVCLHYSCCCLHIRTAATFHGGASQGAHYANEILCLINGKSVGWLAACLTVTLTDMCLTCVFKLVTLSTRQQQQQQQQQLASIKIYKYMNIIHHIKVYVYMYMHEYVTDSRSEWRCM